MTDGPTKRLGAITVGPSRARAATRPATGELIGDWEVVRRLAGGGFGAVYEVRHRTTRRPAALKLLHAHLVTSPEMLARFDREIRVIQSFDHPNVVQLVAAGGSADGRPFLCMELLDGDELSTRLDDHGAMSPDDTLAVLAPLCDALATAHDRGIIHRDIKAANVFVCRPAAGERVGRVVLLDFGIAKLSDAFATELTATSQALGTPSSMAPEQIHGKRADQRSDIYALGALVFHMLTGQLPFDDVSPTMTQYLHMHARRPRVSTLVDVPPRLDDLVTRAMAIDPADRFGDVRELLAAARAAVRESTRFASVADADASAILVSVRDRGGGVGLDDAVLADLESVVPEAERALAASGYTLAVDLGSSALFVARVDAGAAMAAATAAWHQLAGAARSPRVQIGLCVHRGPLIFAHGEIQPSPLLRPATWRVPDVIDGLWVTGAIDPASPAGRRIA